MFCRKCGASIDDGSVFCSVCGAQLNGGAGQAPQGQFSQVQAPVPPPPPVQIRYDQPVRQTEQAPAAVPPVSHPPASSDTSGGKKKSKIGILAVAGVAAAAGIFAVSRFAGTGGGGGGGVGEILKPPAIISNENDNDDNGSSGKNTDSSGAASYVVDAQDPGSMASRIEQDSDRVEELIELARTLGESGDKEAAEAIYSMIPHAALDQEVAKETRELENSSLRPLLIYYSFTDAKDMYESVFGGEGE